jgi:hypothetical protein
MNTLSKAYEYLLIGYIKASNIISWTKYRWVTLPIRMPADDDDPFADIIAEYGNPIPVMVANPHVYYYYHYYGVPRLSSVRTYCARMGCDLDIFCTINGPGEEFTIEMIDHDLFCYASNASNSSLASSAFT